MLTANNLTSLFAGKRKFNLADVKTAMIELQEFEKTIDDHVHKFYSELNKSVAYDDSKMAQLATDYLRPLNDALDRHNKGSFACQIADLRDLISKKMYLKCNEQNAHQLKKFYDKLGNLLDKALVKSNVIFKEIMSGLEKTDNVTNRIFKEFKKADNLEKESLAEQAKKDLTEKILAEKKMELQALEEESEKIIKSREFRIKRLTDLLDELQEKADYTNRKIYTSIAHDGKLKDIVSAINGFEADMDLFIVDDYLIDSEPLRKRWRNVAMMLRRCAYKVDLFTGDAVPDNGEDTEQKTELLQILK